MSGKKRMTPAQKAAARWDEAPEDAARKTSPATEEPPAAPSSTARTFGVPLMLILIVAVIGFALTGGQGA